MPEERLSRQERKARGYSQETVQMGDLLDYAYAEAQALAVRIPEVFGSPPRPLITRSVAVGLDDEWVLTRERGLELAAMDREQDWREVTDEDIERCQGYFAFSDAEGWRFYLPAYLRHYLSQFPNCNWQAVYWACVTRSQFDLLTPEQVAFVDEFVALCHAWQEIY